ncbi:BZ3500_MvSof-1268-A1-R1_Chr9g10549 [Microbotryum saponariae]|uniref:BZ3500_MvSof-1268-A1-R1_Chr9g10549 protein n=1 Tax=Microbotryum saponariae TaxID=289078 RepID=A0A2X0KBG4_9BASI|nr:BZ3501_MvSof-1269-A2-R1_Chr9g10298 [Microbotryum saponariae]SDA00278.1 BZ3500_MvSof-1268-A1-R1_Chr9g10549 [Microbotryum saponariae]
MSSEPVIGDQVVAPSAGAGTIVKELAAGTIAGWAQVMTGQPFDIVKVRLQSGTQYSGALECATRILKDEGALAFYKGTSMPLVGIGACVSLQFACLQAGKRFFASQNVGKVNLSLSLGQLYLAGAFAGVGNSIASTPVEHIRIRLQTQTTALYSGPVDAISKIYRTDGIRGIYKGQGITLLREFHGYGAYFLGYEAFVEYQLRSKNLTRKELPMASAALGGVAAGYAMWFTTYPIDVIKSRIQTDGFASQAGTAAKKYNGSWDCAKQLYREAGLKAFTKGLTPTLIRSPVVNGVTFLVFEQVMQVIG